MSSVPISNVVVKVLVTVKYTFYMITCLGVTECSSLLIKTECAELNVYRVVKVS